MFRNPTTDLIIILVIALLIFGPKRLPGLGKQLGTGLREFKDSITGDSKDSDDPPPPQINEASSHGMPSTPAQTPASVPVPAPQQSVPEAQRTEVGSSERRS
jgi:sec-independent protein translocase protein TatA